MMSIFFYNIILIFISPFFLFGLYKKKTNKPNIGNHWKEHFGIVKPLNRHAPPIWIHTVSVGEVLAAVPLIKRIQTTFSDTPILVTTTTSTGKAQVVKAFGDSVEHRYMPLDLPLCMNKFLSTTHPKALIILETELWPNSINAIHKANIPIAVVNARLSDKSFSNYRKIRRFFLSFANKVDTYICQSENDAQNFINLGVSQKKVYVSGSIKYDISVPKDIRVKSEQLRHSFLDKDLVWIAASTHQGEDEQILDAHYNLKKHGLDALLILVPRHPERFNKVMHLCNKSGLKTQLRSQYKNIKHDTSIYLGDTMGELLVLINSSDICFMGGSLLGEKVGGHNLLEPAALGKPILSGPSLYNFQEIANQLRKADALRICENSASISEELILLSQCKKEADEMGQRALAIVESNRGALKKTVSILTKEIL